MGKSKGDDRTCLRTSSVLLLKLGKYMCVYPLVVPGRSRASRSLGSSADRSWAPFFFFRQDDENGWQLRVAPEREPAEERGHWTRYTAEAGGDNADGSAYPGEDLYYNAVTGERTFETLWSVRCFPV